MNLQDVLSEDERLELWAEMMFLATIIQEYADSWWSVDPGLRRANERRGHGDEHQPHPAESVQE
jgi:hypothetical protein